MTLKGMSSMGVPVHPAPTLPCSSSDDWERTGPDAWMVGPRQRTAPQSFHSGGAGTITGRRQAAG